MTSSTYVLTNGRDTIVTYPYSIYELYAANPNVSFPIPTPDSILAQYNVFPVEDTPQPPYNYMTQNIALVNPTKQGGQWIQQWSVTEATPEEQAERLAQYRASLSCTPMQGKIELNNQGLLDEAEAEIAASDRNTQIAWANATIWYRTSPLIEALAVPLGLSPDDLDNLFEAAKQITV